MKKLFPLFLLCVLLCGCAGKEPYDNDAVRLHIIANSDSPFDQRTKLQVRDFLLQKYGTLLQNAGSAAQAYDDLQQLLKAIEADTATFLQQKQLPYTCHAEAGVFAFPTRTYDTVTLPAGNYRALRVVLGEGAGHNWWCVLYPPLCLVQEDTDAYLQALAAYEAGTAELPTAQVRSFFADKLLGDAAWDRFYARWMKLVGKETA